MKRIIGVFCTLFLILVVSAGIASAQEFRSTLTGRVVDALGAVLPNVNVVVTNTDTGATVLAQTGPDGFYTVPFLAPGPYEVTVEADGFKKYLHSGINLAMSEEVTENITLQVGSLTESMEITADASLLETATATSGQVLATGEIENLPENGRAPLGLVRDMYGVVPKEKHALAQVRPFDNSTADDFAMAGANSASNELLLNGVPNMQDNTRTAGFSPLMDAVNEIRADQFESDAAYGDTIGGTVNITTKSGTNQWHGSASEFNEYSGLAAKPFNFSTTPETVPATRLNQYGGTIGGPILKNKLFFFYAYEGVKDSTPTTGGVGSTIFSVPTAAERTGDFSALLALNTAGTNPNPYQLYNPYSLANGKRTAITGNIINATTCPQCQLDPVAQAYLNKFLPMPNIAGAGVQDNYFFNAKSTDNYYSNMGRLDYNWSDTDKTFMEMHTSNWVNAKGNVFNDIATGTGTNVEMWGGVLDHTHVFSPTLFLDARLGISRSTTIVTNPSAGFDPTTLGFASYMKTSSILSAIPIINFNKETGTEQLGQAPGSITPFTAIQLFAAVTKVWNRHTIKVGPDIRSNKISRTNPGNSAGTFTFAPNWVTQTTSGAGAPPFGAAYASFLLGLPTSGSFDVNEPTTTSSFYYGSFVQDDYHVKRNLTINIGLRIEHETAEVESNNRQIAGFNLQAQNLTDPAAQTAWTAYLQAHPTLQTTNPLVPSTISTTGGLLFTTPNNRTAYSLPSVYLSPRFGLAWSPGILHDKTVIRAGFGIFDNPFNTGTADAATGFSLTTPMQANAFATPVATLSGAGPFPTASNPIQQPTGSALGVNTALGQSITFLDPNLKQPYCERFSIDIQHQLMKDLMIDVGAIHSHSVHLSYTLPLGGQGDLPVADMIQTVAGNSNPTQLANLTQKIPSPYAGLVPGVTATTNVNPGNLLAPFSAFSAVSEGSYPGAWSNYDMLAVRVTKRFSYGLQFDVSYEHSRNLQASQLLLPNDPGSRLYYGTNTSDFPNHFSIIGSYNLPFGHGRQHLANTKSYIDAFVGGWTLNTIYTYESGAPLSWGNVIPIAGQPLNFAPENLTAAFNTAAFDRTAADKPVAQNIRTFPLFLGRQDSTNNVDLSMFKGFTITERVHLQFRFEAFNAFNRVSFGAPDLTPTDAGTTPGSAFGTIGSQANSNRVIQMGLRLTF